jgi:hypothetical protein
VLTALPLRERAAALRARRIAVAALAEHGVERLAVGAPLHERDLGLALAGVGVDLDVLVGVLVLVEVDERGVVGADVFRGWERGVVVGVGFVFDGGGGARGGAGLGEVDVDVAVRVVVVVVTGCEQVGGCGVLRHGGGEG